MKRRLDQLGVLVKKNINRKKFDRLKFKKLMRIVKRGGIGLKKKLKRWGKTRFGKK